MKLFRRPRELQRPSTPARDDRSRTELAQLRQVIDALPTAVLVCDGAGKRLLQNGTATALQSDYQVDSLLQATIDEVLTNARRGDLATQTLALSGIPTRAFEVAAKPLPDEAFVVTVDDISERVQLEAMRRDFVANVSHELRTPIGALVLLTESLREEQRPEAVQRINDHIASEAARAGRLVEALLGLSRLESPQIVEAQPIHVASLVRSATQRLVSTAEQQHVKLQNELLDEDMVVIGDVDDLVSAVANVIENAVKYSNEDGIVTVAAYRQDAYAEITVADSGVGIPAVDLDRIFERFYRVDRARSRGTGGTGLGLAIVRHVIANHGGEVEVQSREGEGSVFTLRLPLAS